MNRRKGITDCFEKKSCLLSISQGVMFGDKAGKNKKKTVKSE